MLAASTAEQASQHAAHDLIRDLAYGAFRCGLHQTIMLAAARPGGAKDNILQTPQQATIVALLAFGRWRIGLTRAVLHTFFQHLKRRLPVDFILIFAVQRRAIDKTVALIVSHRPHP